MACGTFPLTHSLARSLTYLLTHLLTKIIMAKHNKLVEEKNVEIERLTARADKLAGAQERLEKLAKVHYSLEQETAQLRAQLEGHEGDDVARADAALQQLCKK